ncbi:hypothetical protein [Streptomyces spectabilis]|nr:hypothetical protein [Streptomyces spectabilis]MBB5106592.1 hypothetical protein [Streptomyces spectabilis]MCI3903551.1 hypothetical protein [Streptomyces spectabilis]GGV48212.1 hypothetical protein GCM10010245_75840 [Streptomyces spectabilis]
MRKASQGRSSSVAERWAAPLAWGVFLGGAGAAVAFGDRLWRLAGEAWAVGGYLFGGLCGFGVLVGWAAAMDARKRGRWVVAALAAGVSGVATVALVSLVRGRDGRLLGSLGRGPGGRMWVEDHPGAQFAVLGGLACGALLLWRVLPRRATGRRRRA